MQNIKKYLAKTVSVFVALNLSVAPLTRDQEYKNSYKTYKDILNLLDEDMDCI